VSGGGGAKRNRWFGKPICSEAMPAIRWLIPVLDVLKPPPWKTVRLTASHTRTPLGRIRKGNGHPAWHPYEDGICLVSVSVGEYSCFFIMRELWLLAKFLSTEWRDQ